MSSIKRKSPQENIKQLQTSIDQLLEKKRQIKTISPNKESVIQLSEINIILRRLQSKISYYRSKKVTMDDNQRISRLLRKKDPIVLDASQIDDIKEKIIQMETELQKMKTERKELKTQSYQKQLNAAENGIYIMRDIVPKELSRKINSLSTNISNYKRRAGLI